MMGMLVQARNTMISWLGGEVGKLHIGYDHRGEQREGATLRTAKPTKQPNSKAELASIRKLRTRGARLQER